VYIKIGGVPVDLNSGMTEALRNPPPGFRSRYRFEPENLASRLAHIPWFSRCGAGPEGLQITPAISWAATWAEAAETAESPDSEGADLEAQNQLTLWLSLNQKAEYATWNERVVRLRAELLEPLFPRWTAFKEEAHLGDWFLHTVRWQVLGAAMENEYLSLGHPATYFLELLRVYEAGRLPCGWRGPWPNGALVVH
jgi:hypothetical protein